MAKVKKQEFLYGNFVGVNKKGEVLSIVINESTKSSDVLSFLESNKELKIMITDEDRIFNQRRLMKKDK